MRARGALTSRLPPHAWRRCVTQMCPTLRGSPCHLCRELSLTAPPAALADAIRDMLATPMALAKVRVMTRHEFQAESWFKVEILALLEQLQAARLVARFGREVAIRQSANAAKVDFVAELDGRRVAIELKTALVGRQGHDTFTLPFYSGRSYVGSDTEKLLIARQVLSADAFCLILAHAAPPESHWQTLVAGVVRFCPSAAVRLARLDSVSPDLAIGWLEVQPVQA